MKIYIVFSLFLWYISKYRNTELQNTTFSVSMESMNL